MSNPTPDLKLVAMWRRELRATARWQTLQVQLSNTTETDASAWTRRSSVICKWRALPAGVSAPALNRMG
ncbi:MAG TPA: hypothetical protein VFO82_03690 [Steroidobacteraceae bacterium]|nr:hypothetical protein [Steroidobacteraceae bacterium]